MIIFQPFCAKFETQCQLSVSPFLLRLCLAVLLWLPLSLYGGRYWLVSSLIAEPIQSAESDLSKTNGYEHSSPFIQKGVELTLKYLKTRRHRYILSSDLGFLLGFNGPKLQNLANKYSDPIKPYQQVGDTLRYGFSATLNVGLVWLLGGKGSSLLPLQVPDPQMGNQHKWSLGFQLRNMLSVGEASLTYYNKKSSPRNFYNIQDLRAFYALQAVFSGSYLFSPLWELQFYIGPSLNINFYQQSRQEFFLTGIQLINLKEITTKDSEQLGVVSLGAVAGISVAKYFYSFLAVGISTQFVLNVSPYQGPEAWQYSLGQFVLGLYLQVSL